MRNLAILLVILAASLTLCGCKRSSIGMAGGFNPVPVWRESAAPLRLSTSETNAAEPAIANSSSGQLFVVWVNHVAQHQADVMIARLDEKGQMNSPVRVNPRSGMARSWRGDPPTIAVAPSGSVFVGWTGQVGSESDHSHSTTIYISASHDEGRTFGEPVKVNDDSKPGPHGMHSLAIGNDGRIHVAWLDERNLASAPAKDMKSDHPMEANRDLFVSSSIDGGRSFAPNQQVAAEVCPCCKTAMAVSSDGRVYVSWRQVLPGDFRHIAVASLAKGAKSFTDPVIVSDDQWMIKGCPVSGPSLSVGRNNRLTVTWYTGFDNDLHGVFWSETNDGGRTFSPRKLLHENVIQGTPALVGDREGAAIAVWETIENGMPRVMGIPIVASEQGKQPPTYLGAGQLPAATISGNQLFIAAVVPDADKKAVWLLRAHRKRSYD
jgi:hypothetical protein